MSFVVNGFKLRTRELQKAVMEALSLAHQTKKPQRLVHTPRGQEPYEICVVTPGPELPPGSRLLRPKRRTLSRRGGVSSEAYASGKEG